MQDYQPQWNLRRILIILSRGWWWVVFSLGVSLSAAWLYLRYAEQTYSSEAIIQIDFSTSPSFLTKANNAGVSAPMLPELIDLYLELFSTHDLVEKVVETLELDWEVYTVGRVGNSLVFPTPFIIEVRSASVDTLLWGGRSAVQVRIDSEGRFELGVEDSVWTRGQVEVWVPFRTGELRLYRLTEAPIPPALYEVRKLSKAMVIYAWQSKIAVVPKRGVAVFHCSVVDKSPTRARRFLQTLLEYAKQYERQLRQQSYENALRYIDTLLLSMQGQILEVQDTLSSAERKAELPFMEARRGQVMQSFSEVYQKARDSLLFVEKLRQRATLLLESIQRDAGTTLSLLFVAGELPPNLQTSLSQLNALIERRAALLRVYHPSAPPIAYLNAQLTQQLELLLQSLKEVREGEQYLYAQAARTLAREKEHIYRDLFQERQVSLLQEDLLLRKDIYKSLLERRIALAIDKEAVVSAIRITQPPTLVLRPLSPNPFQIYLIGLVVGLILGLGGPLLRYALTQTISYRADIEDLSPVPVLGELPFSIPSKKQRSPSGLQLEVLRSLRGTLGFLWEPGKPRVLIVTSTVSGEGKTFVAQSLADVYALAGYRVLLIDADLRRASLSQQVGSQEKGLSIFLAQMRFTPEQVEELIVPFLREGLYLLPAGPPAPNFPELLESSTFRELIQYFSQNYDYIVIDSAPLGLVPDTLSILHQVPEAVTLYLFRADYSRIVFLRHLQDLVQQHHLQRVYLLFNGTKLNRPHYGYGYGYGYYGDYGRNAYYYQSGRSASIWEKVREWLPI